MKQFVEVHYFTKPGMRQAFYDILMQSGIAAASRAEEGNEKYDYYLSPHNDDELLLIELWASVDAVAAHSQTPHFTKLGELKQKYVIDTTIMRYDVAD